MNDIIWTPYCGPAPTPSSWMTQWNLDPALNAMLAALFVVAVVATRRGRTNGVAILAVLLGAVLFVSPLCAISSALFSARTLHHLLLVCAIAPLVAWALPRAMRPRLAMATAVQAAVLWAWHAPGAYAAALSSDIVFWMMQLTLLASAVWFWRAVRATSGPGAVAGLLAAMMAMGLLGALLTFAGQPVYAPHFATTLAWGLSPLEDQQAAGLIMWAPASAVYLLAALWRLNGILAPSGQVRTA